MKIIVCLKQTFDTEEKIVWEDGAISEKGVKFVINPYDEYAIEEAVRLKEQFGGEVTVVSLGPDRVESALRTALAMGADRGVHIRDSSAGWDEWQIARRLAAVIRTMDYELILCGQMAVDSGASQGGPRLAEELGIAHVATAVQLQIEDGKAVVDRDVEGDLEIVEAALPLLVTAQQGLNEPRYPSLPGIMKAKKKPIDVIEAKELEQGTDEEEARTVLVERRPPPVKPPGQILQGSIDDQVRQLADLLRKDAKVI
ncbi:electron transfer flavoprotein subunit beta/FixA family protein [Paenibacillus sp. J2TS4]|uniref:electron transfer flavoprotein subunit beta/FixA family protein n=1 Tax=Paenibacillus sp. J2TS4 TaxID=2807194 RepID=UPI001B0A66E8|nr:electron transfer flavoprotein subunit beta/FixA family protein [Paenibacillus sp. J2TS4]GIP32753.1 electron transfer flavoprotein subunit beta [Paenibacillus sp. J2TS4]